MARNVRPVLEEFIPLKNDQSDNKDDGDSISIKKEISSNHTTKEKKNWMSSVQLWNTDESHSPSTNRKLETRVIIYQELITHAHTHIHEHSYVKPPYKVAIQS